MVRAAGSVFISSSSPVGCPEWIFFFFLATPRFRDAWQGLWLWIAARTLLEEAAPSSSRRCRDGLLQEGVPEPSRAMLFRDWPW